MFTQGSHISITLEYSKIAPLTYPYRFYLVAFIPSSIEHSFIVFGIVYISSLICSHIWKLKFKFITKLFHKAFRKCIQLLYLDQVPSHKQALKICWTQKGPNLDQKGLKMDVANFFPDCKPRFFKEGNNISFYTKNQQNLTSHLEDIS